MILNSDLILYHPLWERADNELVNKNGIALFNRLIDVFLIACAIGIMDGTSIDDIETPLETPKSIGRHTYMSHANSDLSDIISFLLQNAILTSTTINIPNDERIKLAFDPDYAYSDKKLSASQFLIGFANYGIEQIFKSIDSKSHLVAINELHQYFEDSAEAEYDDVILEGIHL